MFNRLLVLLAVAAVALAPGGCVSGDDVGIDDEVEGPAWDFGKGDGADPGPPPAFVDPVPAPGETITAARARALTAYAGTLMGWIQPVIDSTFSFRKLAGPRLDATYRVRVEEGSCWSELGRLGTDNDIKTDDDRRRMVVQVQYVVEFLRRFHEDANGYGTRQFDTVVVCPESVIGSKLELEGRTLFVGVGLWFGRIQIQDAYAIRSRWAGGEHLASSDPRRRVWATLDPVGSLGIQLREGVAAAAKYVGGKLDASRNLAEARLRADLHDLVNANVIPEHKASDGRLFRDVANARIDALTGPQLREVATLWRDFVVDADRHEGMKEAVLAAHQATATKSYDIDQLQIGLVNVGNFHDIEVAVSAQLTRGRELVPYVTIEVAENNVRVRQIGLVNVYTIDNVQVNLNVAADRGVETAGLRYALDRV